MIKANNQKTTGSTPPPAQKSPAEVLREKEKSLVSTIMGMKDQIRAAMPKHMDPDRIARIAITAIRDNPKLALCSEASFLGCLLHSTQMGLEPNTKEGLAYLIPYGTECTFQIGYQGILRLAYNTKEYAKIDANFVLPGDHFIATEGYEDRLEHSRGPTDIGTPTKYYGFFVAKDGAKKHKWWSRERIVAHAQKFSKSFGKGPWVEHFDRMSMKTVLIDLFKYSDKSPQLAKAAATDNAIVRLSTNEAKEMILTPSFDYGPEINEAGQTKTQAAVQEQTSAVQDQKRTDLLDRIEKRIVVLQQGGVQDKKLLDDLGLGALDDINSLSYQQLEPVWEIVSGIVLPEPAPAMTEEQHRLDMVGKVKDRIAALKMSTDTVLEKTGMPLSMIERASIDQLTKAYKAIQ